MAVGGADEARPIRSKAPAFALALAFVHAHAVCMGMTLPDHNLLGKGRLIGRHDSNWPSCEVDTWRQRMDWTKSVGETWGPDQGMYRAREAANVR